MCQTTMKLTTISRRLVAEPDACAVATSVACSMSLFYPRTSI
jgi:hypothetical protein